MSRSLRTNTILLITLIGLLIHLETAFAILLPKAEIEVGTEITINGPGFGAGPGKYGGVCFNDVKNNCFISGNKNIIYWNDGSIRIVVPDGLAASGQIIIYDSNNTKVGSVDYKLKPTVTMIGDGTNVIDKMLPGNTLTIDGYGFGIVQRRVFFQKNVDRIEGRVEGKVTSWSPNQIKITVPESEIVTTEILFSNSAGAEVVIPFKIGVPLTNDPQSYLQRYLTQTKIDRAWALLPTKSEVIVAVIDDGIYQNHEDLQGNLWTNEREIPGNGIDDDNNGYIDDRWGYNFLKNTNEIIEQGNHGTLVSGFIGAVRNNNTGIAGIAERVQLMSLLACSEQGCDSNAVQEAIRYATDNGAQIINISLGSNGVAGYSDESNAAIRYAYEHGVVIVIAAGNGDLNGGRGYDLTRVPQSPVCNDNGSNMVLGIGATDTNNRYRTEWSNYGDCVDVYAPGEDVLSTSIVLGYKPSNGTSFSSPIVAGVAALILSAYPEMSNTTLYNYIINNSDANGILNAEAIAQAINATYDPTNDIRPTVVASNVLSDGERFAEDIKDSEFKTAIEALKNKGVVAGYDDGTFKPKNTINRAEFMKIVMGASVRNTGGTNCFSDVTDEWFAPFVCAGKDQDVVNGYSDGSFHPSDPINVAEALKIVLKAFKIGTRTASNGEAWYAPFTEYASANNLYLYTFDAENKQITREDMAELVYRLFPK